MCYSFKDKKGITITNAFQKILDESKRKPKKIWVDKGSEFNIRSMKSWLEKNYIEMNSTHNERKSVIAERFIDKYIDKLDDMVEKYNNTYHSTIKMRPVDVKSNTYIDSSKEINDKNPKFIIGDNVRILKYKIFSEKVTLQIRQKKLL